VSTCSADSGVPERAGLVLGTLILVAAVANLNLSVAHAEDSGDEAVSDESVPPSSPAEAPS
jgi:hypothetical protein